MKEIIKVKSIITLLTTLVFCYLAITGKVDSEQFMMILAMVFTYYFNKDSKEIKLPESKKEEIEEIKY